MRRCDSLTPLPPRFVSFAWRYHSGARLFAPAGGRAPRACGPGFWSPGSQPELFCGDDRASQVPGWTFVCMPCSSTPEESCARPLRRTRCCLPLVWQRRLLKQSPFEALSHGLLTRCLRFAGWVAPPPRKTRFQLAANLRWAGLRTRWSTSEGFAMLQTMSSFLLLQAWPGATKAVTPAHPRIGRFRCGSPLESF